MKDHSPVIKLANTKLTTPIFTSVPWNPTVRNEVATISISVPILAESPTIGALTISPQMSITSVGINTPTVPRSPGVTLLAGHVNWVGQGGGARGEIGQLVPGDQVMLNWGEHETTWQIIT